jgi:hypothetical protein
MVDFADLVATRPSSTNRMNRIGESNKACLTLYSTLY